LLKLINKKSLNIPKWRSDPLNQIGTYNTMAKRKWTKGQEGFENTKGVIRIRKSKKNRQHNDQKKKYKKTNNDLQNIRAARTPLKSGG